MTGDLDPSTSPHHLVSFKTAYLKLHHLLDMGCVFVGHGLKQDFRMLNLTVPPEQVCRLGGQGGHECCKSTPLSRQAGFGCRCRCDLQ